MRFFCLTCNQEYDANLPRWRCDCGGLLQIETTTFFTKKSLSKRENNLWRFQEAIPVKGEKVTLSEGFTPIIQWKANVKIKLDYVFPTCSFKDRGATVLISKIREWGIGEIVEDSSGNAGCSIAAYAARAKIKANIIVPKNCSLQKLKQIQAYGANVIYADFRDRAAELALKMSSDIFYASHVYNPFFYHGTKTIAFEIWEQTNGRLPEVIFAQVGNGTLLLGLFIGLEELFQFGLINKIPTIIGVQAENCPSLIEHLNPPKSSIAEGIAIANPLRKNEILSAVERSQGKIITVTETEIQNAQTELSKNGLFVEPTAAVGFAGLQKTEMDKEAESLIILTGSGLKRQIWKI